MSMEESNTHFVAGWKRDTEDGRDFKYSAHAPDEIPDPLPSSVDLTNKMPPVFHQGDLGSCTANAISAAVGYLRWKDDDSKNDWVPSRLFIYYYERLLEGTVNEDPGAQIRDGIKVVGEYGAPEEELWPYEISKFREKPPAQVITEATQHKAYNYYRVNWSNIDEIKGCLAAGYPIVFGFDVYNELQSREVAKTGLLPMPGPKSRKDGGHAVVCVGYNDEIQCPNASKGAVLVRNSWGVGWGISGNFWLPFSYITSPILSDDFWTIRATY